MTICDTPECPCSNSYKKSYERSRKSKEVISDATEYDVPCSGADYFRLCFILFPLSVLSVELGSAKRMRTLTDLAYTQDDDEEKPTDTDS
jgi:hypothetical protein